MTGPSGTSTYTYDGLGNRYQETVKGVTTTFTLDLASNLTQVLDDGTNTYIYGLSRIAQTNASDTEYFLGDALGSVRQLTDASGAVSLAKNYTPFGETRFSTGNLPTDRLYTGQQELTGLGLYNYKARFYDPYITHFIQPDTIIPNPYNPQSLNRYSYALNNPIRYNDPSGHCVGPGGHDFPDGSSACGLPTGGGFLDGAPPKVIMAWYTPEEILQMAGVEMYGNWSEPNISDAAWAVVNAGYSLSGTGAGISWDSAFNETFGDMRFVWGETYNGSSFSGTCTSFSGGCSPGNIDGKLTIAFNVNSYSGMNFSTLVTHELGHTLALWYGWSPGEDHWGGSYATANLGSDWYLNRNKILQCNHTDYGQGACLGNSEDWQHASGTGGSEIFADLFTAWAFKGWSTDQKNFAKVMQASSAMNIDMSAWISAGRK